MKPVGNGMGVIFDLDGVLVDSGWAHKQAWRDLARKEGFEISDEFFYTTFGMQNYQIIPMLTGGASEEQVDRMSEWKEQRYREIIAERLLPLEGAEALLDELSSAGFVLAVGSSAPRVNLNLIVERLGMQRYFRAYVTSEDVSRSKPAPDTFLKAAEKLSLPPCRCAVVEDAVPGVEAAKAAGMSVVAVTSTRRREDLRQADVIVDSLAELRGLDFVKLLGNKPD
jgi:beta-phosphoglucomutase